MKKFVKLVLILLVIFFAAGCSKNDSTKPDDPPTPPPPPIDSVYQLTIRGFITFDTTYYLIKPAITIYLGTDGRGIDGLNPVYKLTGEAAKNAQGKDCYLEVRGVLYEKKFMTQVATTYSPKFSYNFVIPTKNIQTLDFYFYAHLNLTK